MLKSRQQSRSSRPVRDLASLPVGSTAVIEELHTSTEFRRRLLDLGFVPGTVVETVRKSPAGDPIAIRLRGTTIALRLADARQVEVRILPIR
ncbi:MAG: FeoA family protein [Clostridia bacterium]|nr:FeoA family protein [Clostridia bacterium]MDQ7790956.1 FeoA family protein [Clostridia bacterium]